MKGGSLFKKIIENIFIDFSNEWTQIFGQYNWINITPIKIYFENEIYTGECFLEIIILGLGFRLTVAKKWDKRRHDFVERMLNYKKNIEKNEMDRD
jgi:hypothetical protein